jgi:hypothetical protein
VPRASAEKMSAPTDVRKTTKADDAISPPITSLSEKVCPKVGMGGAKEVEEAPGSKERSSKGA